MRRALLVFMMVLLPLQWVWAAAASTYTHESALSAPQYSQHVHDHAHEHVLEQVNAVADADPASFGEDHPHCGGTHLWADMGCRDTASLPFFEPAGARLDTVLLAFDSHVPAGPERPDRSATP